MDRGALFSIARIGIIFTAEQWLIRWAAPTLPAFYGLVTSMTLTVAFFINYAIALFVYDQDMLNKRDRSTKGDKKRLPPQRPEAIPLLGNAISFLWNPREFLQSAGTHYGKFVSTRVYFLGYYQVEVFQDNSTVESLAQQNTLSTPASVSAHAATHTYGMSRQGLAKSQDLAGSASSTTLDNILHGDDGQHALTPGAGLDQTTMEFTLALRSKLEAMIASNSVHLEDLSQWFQGIVTTSVLQSIFGPSLLATSPGFVSKLRKFMNETGPASNSLGLPSFLASGPNNTRSAPLRAQFKKWHATLRAESAAAGSKQPWGTELMLKRQSILSQAGLNTDDASAADLALAVSLCESTVPITMLMILHIINDPALLSRVQKDVKKIIANDQVKPSHIPALTKSPRLRSIYAETLRLYAQPLLVFSSPKEDVVVGRWKLPRGKIGCVDTALLHMDEDVWNTKNGRHPVNTFWAERFSVDSKDSHSGPLRADLNARSSFEGVDGGCFGKGALEGAFLPFGFGSIASPSRFFATNAVLFTVALAVTELDITLFDEPFENSSVVAPWLLGARIQRRR